MTEESKQYKPNDHLANERTYLAWIRTSIGIMAFGFVVVKFSLFVRQIAVVLGTEVKLPPHGYSSVIGIILVAIGSLSIFFAFLQYHKVERQLRDGVYRPSSLMTNVLTIAMFVISLLLIIYLARSI